MTDPDKFKSICPKCGYEQFCGCPACLPHLPAGMKPYQWTNDGEAVICGNCGFTAHADYWLDLEVQQLRAWQRERGEVPTI